MHVELDIYPWSKMFLKMIRKWGSIHSLRILQDIIYKQNIFINFQVLI